MRAHIATHPLAASVAAAATTAIAWYVLASVTGLIFHLMPAAPAIAAAWTLRVAGPASSVSRSVAAVAAGTTLGAGTLLVLVAAERPLDEAWLTLIVMTAGTALAALLLRARASRPVADRTERSEA